MIEELPVSRTPHLHRHLDHAAARGARGRRSPRPRDSRAGSRAAKRRIALRLTARKPEVVSVTRWPHHQRDDRGEKMDADAPHGRAAVAAALDEARADDDVGSAVEDRLQEPADLARVVLPVTVDLDRECRSRARSAYWYPVCTAPPMPRLNGSLSTIAPACSAASAVRSVEPSSTTTTSKSGSAAWISPITAAIESSSLSAGMITIRRTADQTVVARPRTGDDQTARSPSSLSVPGIA